MGNGEMKERCVKKIIMMLPAMAVAASMCLPISAEDNAQISCDLAVRKSGQSVFDTQSDHVFKIASGESLEFQTGIDVTPLRDSIVIFADDLETAIKDHNPGITNVQAADQAFSTVPTGLKVALNAAYALPAGMSFDTDAASTVRIADADQAKVFSVDPEQTKVSGTQLTASIKLNPGYTGKSCREIIADLEKVSSHVALVLGGAVVGNDMQTGEITCSVSGSYSYVLPSSVGDWNVSENLEGVQLTSCKDYQHSLDASFKKITLTLSTRTDVPAPSAAPVAEPTVDPLPSQDPLPSTGGDSRPITPIASDTESKENAVSTEQENRTPNTGDTAAIWMWGIMFAVSLAVSAGVLEIRMTDR